MTSMLKRVMILHGEFTGLDGQDRLSKLKNDLRDDGQKFPCSEGNTCDSSTLIRMRLQTDGQAVAKDTAGSRLAKEAMDT
ncbi:hypothetical protein DD237_005764 [Peronospora effusa]|uniref:Uncharacterized protein n=1 Tax=Peronospora effusa TaxID=542832 RepID=A0A425C8Y2_9STRA|nr:hypothetical protein DD237_005764 [Peronospora effusa]